MENKNHNKKKVGFALMSPEKRLEAAKQGGKISAMERIEKKNAKALIFKE